MPRTPYDDPEAEKSYQDSNTDSTKLAGDVLQFPIDLKTADQRRLLGEEIKNSGRGLGGRWAKILKGPGAN